MNNISIKKIIRNNLQANFCAQIVGIFIQVISLRIYIDTIGIDQYGRWLGLSTLTSYIALLDFGFTAIMGNNLVMMIARRDFRAANGEVVCLIKLIGFINFLTIVLLVIFAFLIPYQDKQIIYLLAFVSMLSMWEGLAYTILRSDNLFSFSTWISIVQKIIETCIIFWMLQSFKNLLLLCVGLSVFKILWLILISIVVRKKSKWINLNFRDSSLIKNLKNLKISFSYFLFNASGTLKTQGIISLLSIYASTDLLVMYAALKTLCNASFQIIKTIQNAISPEISKIYVIRLAILKKIFFKLSNLGFWFSVTSNIFILLSAKTVITIWSGGKIVVELELLLLVVMANIFYCYWSNLSTILLATNAHSKFSAQYFIVSIITLILSYFLITKSYLNWLFSAQILSEIIVTIIFLKLSNKYISNYYKFIMATLRLKF